MDDRERVQQNLLLHVDLLRRETDQLLALVAELPLESRFKFEKLHLHIENIVGVMRQELNRAHDKAVKHQVSSEDSILQSRLG
jgi:hypothetical protein